jgi:hypothetical protein
VGRTMEKVGPGSDVTHGGHGGTNNPPLSFEEGGCRWDVRRVQGVIWTGGGS